MHPVQEHVNTLGIDCLVHRSTEYHNKKEDRSAFNPKVLQLNLINIKRLQHGKYSDRKKSAKMPTRESNPQPAYYVTDALTIRPPAPKDKLQCM